MAQGAPVAKKFRWSVPELKVTAQERARQFPEDLYSDANVLFCKLCSPSIDYVRLDTILKSKKHIQNKDRKDAGPSTQQVTLRSMAKSKDLRGWLQWQTFHSRKWKK